MPRYINSPIRVDKIKEIKEKLNNINTFGKKMSLNQKLYHIFAYRFKHFDTEEEEEAKGVSLRELALILYEGKVTIEQMIEAETDDEVLAEIYKFFVNTKLSLKRFRRWRRETGNRDPDEDTGFNIHCLRTKKGKWYIFNIMNDKDMDKVELRNAKIHLGLQKRIDILNDIANDSRHKARMEAKYKEIEAKLKEGIMRKAKTWDGKQMYFDVDFTGVNLKDVCKEDKDVYKDDGDVYKDDGDDNK